MLVTPAQAYPKQSRALMARAAVFVARASAFLLLLLALPLLICNSLLSYSATRRVPVSTPFNQELLYLRFPKGLLPDILVLELIVRGELRWLGVENDTPWASCEEGLIDLQDLIAMRNRALNARSCERLQAKLNPLTRCFLVFEYGLRSCFKHGSDKRAKKS